MTEGFVWVRIGEYRHLSSNVSADHHPQLSRQNCSKDTPPSRQTRRWDLTCGEPRKGPGSPIYGSRGSRPLPGTLKGLDRPTLTRSGLMWSPVGHSPPPLTSLDWRTEPDFKEPFCHVDGNTQ